MNNPKRYLVTAALPYANGPVHIGHLAGCYIPADIYVRYLRAQKRDVKFVGGSDEHGVPITIRAMKEGITPQQVVDKFHAIIKESMAQMGISFDIYSRTSNKVHHETAAAFFKKMYDDGLFEEKETEQYYDETAKTFLADRYITGTCPVCGNPNAYGDQCEKCGSTLSPEQLINPRSTLSDAVPVKKKTTHWYFPLQNYEAWLKEWILEGHKEWKNNVYGQCKSWLDSGLQSRAMTRDSNWGIKVPKLASPPATKEEASLPSPEFIGIDAGGFIEHEKAGSIYDYQTADPIVYGLLKKFAEEHKAIPTEAENLLWQMLKGKKLDSYKFRRQHIIGSSIADFVCISQKLIVEVDGLIHQVPENKISDEQRTVELNKFGFEVIRFTNEQVINDTDFVLNTILSKLTEKSLERSETKNPPLEGREAGKVLYVWFDAPIGYISATKELTDQWADYWCKEDTKLVHFIGKDNIVFHCIIFPAMLKAHGGFVLPDNVPANEFLNIEGEKVSTSRNWAVWVNEYVKDFPGCEDVLRYVLCANAPETKDNDFTWKDFQDRNNSELVNIFGNFVNRTWVLMHKLCGGKVPKLHEDILDEKDKALIEEIQNAKLKIEKNIEEFKFRDALFEVIDLSRKGNKYMQEKEPWIVAKKASLPSKGGFPEPANYKGPFKFSESNNPSLQTREGKPYDYQTADPIIYGLLKKFVEEQRSNPTEAENILWQTVRGKKLDSFKFRRQHIIGTYIADFVCLSQKLIVEVDGLVHEIPENKLNDADRTAELNKFGFEVIRFTNDEIIKNTDFVLNSILSKLTEKKLKFSGSENPPLEGREASSLDSGEAQKSIDNCLHLCLQLTANLAIFINPFLPNTAAKMLGMMKVVDKMLDWSNAGKIKLLSVGYSLREPQLLFRKIEDAEIAAQVQKLKSGLIQSQTEQKQITVMEETKSEIIHQKSEIVFDDFDKIDLKVGTIVAAEKVEKADKLLKLQINLGFEVRTVVSGIALHYQPDAIVGKQVVVVANLAPRKMRGIESNGMILMSEDKAGKLHFVSPESVTDNGSGVK